LEDGNSLLASKTLYNAIRVIFEGL